jgi:hypothetical protein
VRIVLRSGSGHEIFNRGAIELLGTVVIGIEATLRSELCFTERTVMRMIAKVMEATPTKASRQCTGQTPAAASRGWGWGSASRHEPSTAL